MNNNCQSELLKIENLKVMEVEIKENLLLITSDRLQDAFEKSKQIIELSSDEQLVLHFFMSFVEKQRYFDKIFELYDLAIQKYPSQYYFLQSKALALLKFNKIDEALEYCNYIISKHPTQIDTYKLKQNVLKRLGRQPEAIEMWSQFIIQFPEEVQGYNNLIQALEQQKNYKELIIACDKATKLFPDNSKSFQKIKAQSLCKVKAFINAIKVCDELIQQSKKEVIYYELKVKVLKNQKKFISKENSESNPESEHQSQIDQISEQIINCYSEGIQETEDENLESKRIEFLMDTNKKQEALNYINQMIEKYPKNIDGYNFKANILSEQNKSEEIIELYDQAILHSSSNIEIYETKAHYLEQSKNWLEALKSLNIAQQQSLESTHLYLRKFNSLIKLGLIKQARNCLRMIPNIYYDTDQEMEQCDF